MRGRGSGRALLRSGAGCQAPAPGEAAPARNRTLRTQSRAWGREAPGPAAGLGHRSGDPAAPADSRGGQEEVMQRQNPEQHPFLRLGRRRHLLRGPARGPDGHLVPDSTGAWDPPRRPAAPRVRTSRLPAPRRRPCPPAARPPGVPAPREGLRARGRVRREARRPDPPWRAARSGLQRSAGPGQASAELRPRAPVAARWVT